MTTQTTTTQTTTTDAAHALRATMTGAVLTPADAGYDAARRHDLPISVRGGGHSILRYSAGDDRTEHPDLFWAVRGGGGNFGVVTSFEFAPREVTDALRPHASGAGYVNTPDAVPVGQVADVYAAKYDRLARIKACYDPQNVFRRNANSLPAATDRGGAA